MLHRLYYLTLTILILFTSACSTNSLNLDSSSSGTFHSVPQYALGLKSIESTADSLPPGAENAAIEILSSKLKGSGLRTSNLNNKNRGALTPSDSYPNENLDNFEFEFSSVITGYSEVEERIDTTVFQQRTSVARVSLEFTLSDIVSGKPILSESVTGEHRKITSGIASTGGNGHHDASLINGALDKVYGKVTEKIVQALSAIPFQGKIIDVMNQSVILKAGTRSHLEAGTELDVFHIGEAILDLGSGKITGYLENKIGSIKITKHRNSNLSEARIVSGVSIKAGDIVRQEP